MASLAQISVKVVAVTDDFIRGINQAQAKLKSFGQGGAGGLGGVLDNSGLGQANAQLQNAIANLQNLQRARMNAHQLAIAEARDEVAAARAAVRLEQQRLAASRQHIAAMEQRYGAARIAITTFAVGSAVALHRLAEQTAEDDLATARLAHSLGTTVNNMVALKEEARRAGVDFRILGMSMAHLSRLVGEAEGGNRRARGFFAEIGIFKFRTEEVKDAAKAWERVSAAIAELPTRTERAAAVYKLFGDRTFGKSAAALLPLIDEGPAGLKKMREEVERTGQAFGENGAAALEQWNESTKQLSARWAGAKTQITQDLLPAMKALNTAGKGALTWATLLTGQFRGAGSAISYLANRGSDLLVRLTGHGKTEAQVLAEQAEKQKAAKPVSDMDDLARLLPMGLHLTEQMQPPLEHIDRRMEELRKMLNGGAIDKTTFDRAATSMFNEQARASEHAMRLTAPAMEANSVAAASAIVKSQMRPPQDVQTRIANLANEQTALQRQMKDYQAQMAAALSQMRLVKL